MLECNQLIYKNKIKEYPEISISDYLQESMQLLEKQANKLVMKTISEVMEEFKELGFNYSYYELKAIILNMYELEIESSYDVENLDYKVSLVLRLRPNPINFYNKDNVSNYDIKMRLLQE